MDPASAIAGFIALAALTAETAIGITSTLKSICEFLKNLEQRLHSLSRLGKLLAEISEAH
jgi:hypothetical protein